MQSSVLLRHSDAAALACDAAHDLAQVVLREALVGPEADVLGSGAQDTFDVTHAELKCQGERRCFAAMNLRQAWR